MFRKALLTVALILVTALTACGQDDGIYYLDKIIVLMYHHLDTAESPATISPGRFSRHLEMLRSEGFNVISIQDLGEFLDGRGDLPPNAVVITFDDGYESVYNYAFPLLQKQGFPAAVFMIVSRIGNRENEIPKLNWEQMREMQKAGVTFQSHTYDSHYYVTINEKGDQKPVLAGEIYNSNTGLRETPVERSSRVLEDLRQSKLVLEEQLGTPVEYFAVPYGWYDQRVVEAAQTAGLKYIFTIKPGVNSKKTDPVRIWRINAGSPEITAEDLKKVILKEAR